MSWFPGVGVKGNERLLASVLLERSQYPALLQIRMCTTLSQYRCFVTTPQSNHRNFSGSLTFQYYANDNVEPLNVTATVTLIIAPPPAVIESPAAAITGANYSWTMDYSATSYTPPISLLYNVTSPNPDANLTVVGVITPPSVGDVTVYPNGSYVFIPPPDWMGKCLGCGVE